jgi:hypothetical protein
MVVQNEDSKLHEGEYIGDYEMLCKLVELQELSGLAIVNKIDLTKDLPNYFENEENRALRFKLCFIDCGIKNVLEESLKYFYPRIVKGGILIMDHYNNSVSPYESEIVEKYAGKTMVQSPFTRQPTAYLIK